MNLKVDLLAAYRQSLGKFSRESGYCTLISASAEVVEDSFQ